MRRRSRFADKPIRHKIASVIMLISGAALLCSCAAFLTYQWYASRESLARRFEIMAAVVGDQATAALEFQQRDDAEAILRSLRAERQVTVAALYDRNGQHFAHYVRDDVQESAVPARPGRDGCAFAHGDLAAFSPLVSSNERIGTIYLSSDMLELTQQLLVNLAAAGLVLIFVAGVVFFASRKTGDLIAKPVLKLAEVVQSVSTARDYSLRAESGRRDETGRLIDGFNDMLAQIQQRDAALAAARDELEQRVAQRTQELQKEVVDRRAAEELLKQKDLLLTEAQDIAQLGSWEWTFATDRVVWSDEVHRTYGVMPSRFGGNYASFVASAHPDDRAAFEGHLKSARDKREGCEVDIRIIRPDGAVRHVHIRGKVALADDGRAVRLVGTLQDVTARYEAEVAMKNLNRELQSSMADLAAVNKELEGFSYSVSHDLRAPLRAIAGFSRMLLDDYGDRVEGEGRRYVDVIIKNVQKMGQLIDDLLAFSRLGRKPIQATAIDMDRLVAEVVAEHREAEPGRAVEVKVLELPSVRGDSAMIRQVVVNLVSNALKYSRGRTPAVVEITGSVEADQAAYHVRDNGVGFEMAYAHKLFGVFQRLHSSTEFEGTGVGLALVQRIVQRHGGRVWAEGRPGEGATFSFTLPSQPSAARPGAADARPLDAAIGQ